LADVPRHFHFVFGLRPQTEPFHLVHYLCLESCRQLNAPAKMFFHYRHMPHGDWWDRIAPHLTLRPVHESPKGFAPQRYADSPEGRFIQAQQIDYAHEADFIRLEALIDSGGVYADMDTLFVSPYPDELFRHACVLGEENAIAGKNGILAPSLCNAVIIARPAAPFLQAWRASADEAFDGTWSSHSCQLATQLWRARPSEVHVAPQRCFYEFGASRIGLQSLFMERARKLSGIHSIHLWAHLWWSENRRDFSSFHSGLLTESYVRNADTTYAHLARRFL
jgi:hypothetical protein